MEGMRGGRKGRTERGNELCFLLQVAGGSQQVVCVCVREREREGMTERGGMSRVFCCRLLEVRSRLYELLTHCIPADIIMKVKAAKTKP